MSGDNVVLQTPRLVLREFTFDDVAALVAIESDPRVVRFLTFDAQTPEQARQRVTDSFADRSAVPRLTHDLAAISKSTGELIGRCGLGNRRIEHREAAIWYLFSPAVWGQGLATEGAEAMLRLAFERLGCHRVYADCDPRNVASCNLARRIGMQREGRMRQNYFLKGEWCDADIFGILEDEWRERASAS